MRAVQQEVAVTLGDARQPGVLHWQGRTYRVTVLDEWRYGGRWWTGELPRSCYLVQAGPLTAELHREDAPEGRWWLARVQD